MRVFITEVTAFIGDATVEELLKHGDQIMGLERSDPNVESLTQAGVEYHRGDLEDPESLKRDAIACDGVIHLGFVHDSSRYARATAIDNAAPEAMLNAMAATGKPLVLASGTLRTALSSLCWEIAKQCTTYRNAKSESS